MNDRKMSSQTNVKHTTQRSKQMVEGADKRSPQNNKRQFKQTPQQRQGQPRLKKEFIFNLQIS